ncbi:MAG: four helix bundle protein, partial [Bacteroidales bacterium]|nr:four helix bundle protein [Bacteroidales bacterium]
MNPDGLILFQKTYDLILEVHPVIVNKFPKNQRFVLGQKIENTLIAILEIAITINLSKPTVNYFRRLDIEIQKLKIFIRLAKDLKFISIKKYEYLEKKVI